jgi:hypothetical protein
VVVTFASLFEDPEVDGLLATVRDVTESKQALRASEERFRTLADTVPALIWQNDPEGPGGTYANRHFVEFAGRPAERTWAAVERARAEEALLASEEKYSGIFGSIDEGFVVAELLFDDEGKPFDLLVLETNPSFDRMLRTTNAVGKRALEIWGPCRYIRLGGLSFVSQTSFIPPWQIPHARVASAGVEQLCVPRTGEEASAPSRTAMGKRLPFEGPIHAPPPEPPVNGLPGRSKSSGISAVERSTRCAPESCHSIVERASPGHGGPSGGLASRVHSPTSRKFEKKTHLRAGYGMVGVVLAL